MDFSKLNSEFANMQVIIGKYNNIVNEINNRIRNNQRDISRFETKIKNTKDIIEKDLYKVYIDSIKNENIFIQGLIKCDDKNDKEK